MTLSVVTGLTGAMLLLVGLVGGGFTFSGSVFPKVGGLMRVPCLAAGGLLLIVSVSLAGLEAGLFDPVPVSENGSATPSASPPVTPQPSISTRDAPPSSSTTDDTSTEVGGGTVAATTDVYRAPSLDSEVVGSINQGSEVVIYCTAQGEEVQFASGPPSSVWDFVGNGFVPDVVVYTGTDEPVASTC